MENKGKIKETDSCAISHSIREYLILKALLENPLARNLTQGFAVCVAETELEAGIDPASVKHNN